MGRADALGMYGADMHYVGTYAALLAAGMSKQDAWETAYYSYMFDLDRRYSATGGTNMFTSFFGGRGRDMQSLFHRLDGLTEDQECRFRNCLKGEISVGMGPHVMGLLLHVLGDTYAHSRMARRAPDDAPAWAGTDLATIGMDPEDARRAQGDYDYIRDRGDLPETARYEGPLGHALDGTDPDKVALRKDLAKDYLTDVFNLGGGTSANASRLSLVLGTVDSLQPGLGSTGRFEDALRAAIDDPTNAAWGGWAGTDQQKYNPEKFRLPWQNRFFNGGSGPAAAEVETARKYIEGCLP